MSFPNNDAQVRSVTIEALLARIAQLEGRVEAFQEGYKDKSFEVTALEIQNMDLRANGVDKVTARTNERLRTKLTTACIERNEARARTKELEAEISRLNRRIKEARLAEYLSPAELLPWEREVMRVLSEEASSVTGEVK
jgi:uncharacterized protein involved in exopolysaccharide biosynthesis